MITAITLIEHNLLEIYLLLCQIHPLSLVLTEETDEPLLLSVTRYEKQFKVIDVVVRVLIKHDHTNLQKRNKIKENIKDETPRCEITCYFC